MPVRTLNNTTQGAGGAGILNPAVVGVQTLVPSGNVFNALTILSVPAGITLYIRFGNNPRIGPITDPIAITFQDVPYSDVGEGVFAEVDVAVPASVVTGFVSFRAANAGESGSIAGTF